MVMGSRTSLDSIGDSGWISCSLFNNSNIPRTYQRTMKHKPLEKEFTKWQFTFREIKREKDIAIYEQTRTSDGEFCSYEVIKVRTHDGYEIADNKIDPAEMYPSNELWGTYGFTLPTLKLANKKFEELKTKTFENEESISGVTNQFILELPSGEFTVKDLAKEYDKSVSYIYTQLKKRSDVEVVREEGGGRGKPTKIYKKK